MKLKITQEVKKHIKSIAQNLPKVRTGKDLPVFVKKYGRQLIAEMKANPNIKEPYTIFENGVPKIIRSNKTYYTKISEFEYYDHVDELEKAWKKGGHGACDAYVLKIKNLANGLPG